MQAPGRAPSISARELEADGLVTRVVFDQVPPRVVYDVHPGERSRLEAVMESLCDRGMYRVDRTAATVTGREPLRRPG